MDVGCGDAESAFPLRPRPPYDDLNIAAQRRQKSQQSFNRVVAEVPPEEAGDVGPRQSEQFRRVHLLAPAPAIDFVDAGDELRLQQVSVGIRDVRDL